MKNIDQDKYFSHKLEVELFNKITAILYKNNIKNSSPSDIEIIREYFTYLKEKNLFDSKSENLSFKKELTDYFFDELFINKKHKPKKLLLSSFIESNTNSKNYQVEKRENTWKKWSNEDVEILIAAFKNGKTIENIAQELQRSPKGILRKLNRLNRAGKI